jgi:hypothetical protein
MLIEFVIILAHPNLLTRGPMYTFFYRFTTEAAPIDLKYEFNDFLLTLLTLRVFMIARYFLSLSYYKTTRASRICRMYDEYNSFWFSIRSIFNRDPFSFVFTIAISGVCFFAVNMRIYERVYDNPNRASYPPLTPEEDKIYSGLSPITNTVWFTFITMTTVGYGDYYPRTNFARTIAVFAVITGLLVVSLTTVAFFKRLDLSSAENKIYILLERMRIRQARQEICDTMVNNIFKQLAVGHKLKVLYNSVKDIVRNRPGCIGERIEMETKVKKLEKKRSNLDLELKHLINKKIKSAKKIDGINTTGYIMETIIDDICHAIQRVDDTGQTIVDIIGEMNVAIKKDELLINSLKRKIRNDVFGANKKRRFGRANLLGDNE